MPPKIPLPPSRIWGFYPRFCFGVWGLPATSPFQVYCKARQSMTCSFRVCVLPRTSCLQRSVFASHHADVRFQVWQPTSAVKVQDLQASSLFFRLRSNYIVFLSGLAFTTGVFLLYSRVWGCATHELIWFGVCQTVSFKSLGCLLLLGLGACQPRSSFSL